jgi:CheY-like chemotaxis protein
MLLRDAREARDEAQAASRAKDEFLAMLSHELRNPLNVIAGGISILSASANLEGRLARTAQLVTKQVRHLTDLMDDLLDIARVSSGKIVLNFTAVDLAETVEKCLAGLEDAGRLRNHKCRKSMQSVWVNADETRMEQIVANLLGNAIKFTPQGGRIEVTVTREADDAVLRVQDSGVGIAADLLPRVFDVFVQGDRTIDRPIGGLGVGLTLVRRLTEMHCGTVAATSEGLGRGATFSVRFPLIAPPAPEADRPAPTAAANPKRILIVEDNADAREMLRTLLELQGHEVHEAEDGHAALDRALELRPDVAIIDVGLPRVDGYTLARTIRDRALPIRLIALTGYGTEQDRRRAAGAGFDAHLTKPVEPEKLDSLIRASFTP